MNKTIISQELKGIDQEIENLKKENNKFDLAIWGMLGLFGVVFVSGLSYTNTLMFLIAIIIILMLSFKTRYKKAEHKFELLRAKIQN
jgi:Flp pilus assembly protein TadB